MIEHLTSAAIEAATAELPGADRETILEYAVFTMAAMVARDQRGICPGFLRSRPARNGAETPLAAEQYREGPKPASGRGSTLEHPDRRGGL